MNSDELRRLNQLLNGEKLDPPVVEVEDKTLPQPDDRRTEGGFRLPRGACEKKLRACLGCDVKFQGYYPGLCDICRGLSVDSEDEWTLAGHAV